MILSRNWKIGNLHLIQVDLDSENGRSFLYLHIDTEVLAVQPLPSDTKIAVQLLEMEDVSNDNDNTIKIEDELVHCLDRNELLRIIETMQKISLFLKDVVIV